MVTLDEMMDKLSPQDRERVEARAKELIAEEKSLRDLREARQTAKAHAMKAVG